MTNKEKIEGLKTIEYSKYKSITSYEKLMLYAAYELEKLNVPLTFNYLCVAAYNLFTDVFCLDNEFKNHMSPDRLNRTIMHLKYVKKGTPFLSGTPESGYHLTVAGRAYAIEVESIIKNSAVDLSVSAPIVDKHKKGSIQDYTRLIESDGYKKYVLDNLIDMNLIWKHFNVIPYTQTKKIKATLNEASSYAKTKNDNKCVEYVNKIIERL